MRLGALSIWLIPVILVVSLVIAQVYGGRDALILTITAWSGSIVGALAVLWWRRSSDVGTPQDSRSANTKAQSIPAPATIGGNATSFAGANLTGADLSGQDLACVDIRGADLSGANLGKADLRLAIIGPLDQGKVSQAPKDEV